MLTFNSWLCGFQLPSSGASRACCDLKVREEEEEEEKGRGGCTPDRTKVARFSAPSF